jgi:hypothetical protein
LELARSIPRPYSSSFKVVKLSAERQAEKSHEASWHQAYILANGSWKKDTRRECRKGMQRKDMQAVIIQAGCHKTGRLSSDRQAVIGQAGKACSVMTGRLS